MFKPVVLVRVGLETNGTCLFYGPHSGPSRRIFRIFVPCRGSEEIVPEGTRISASKRRNNNNRLKKNQAKKKKSGNLMKRAQKKFERVPRNFFFCERNPTRVRKEEITNKVRDLIMTL